MVTEDFAEPSLMPIFIFITNNVMIMQAIHNTGQNCHDKHLQKVDMGTRKLPKFSIPHRKTFKENKTCRISQGAGFWHSCFCKQ